MSFDPITYAMCKKLGGGGVTIPTVKLDTKLSFGQTVLTEAEVNEIAPLLTNVTPFFMVFTLEVDGLNEGEKVDENYNVLMSTVYGDGIYAAYCNTSAHHLTVVVVEGNVVALVTD